MNHSRCIIPGILPDNRIPYHRFTQIPFQISLPDALVNGCLQIPSLKMHILADLHEDNCHSCVLAYRYHIFPGYFHIFRKLAQNLPAQGRRLPACRTMQGMFHILREKMVGLDTHLFYCFRDFTYI